jgi:hypothetical protein
MLLEYHRRCLKSLLAEASGGQGVILFESKKVSFQINAQVMQAIMSLNGDLAVIKWKKLWGVYVDARHELNSIYKLDSNDLINDDEPSEEKADQA